jgi:hypothetical protein
VSNDWRAPLSAEKNQSFHYTLHRLESFYGMFSVNLDEALGMRRHGPVDKAYQILSIAPALCEKFAGALRSHLRAMSMHARHFGTAPNMSALDPENFQDPRSQRVARFNGILSRVLLTRRLQFLQKLSTLAELVEDLGSNYDDSALELGEGSSLNTEQCWEDLDASHYDLNTCLRETMVLSKCFLLALPEAQLPEFQASLRQEALPSKVRASFSPRNLAHRRLPTIKGQ